MMQISAKTESEETFEIYLDSQNVKWSRIPTSDQKTPDYRVEHRESVSVFEVKEFDNPTVIPTGPVSPCLPIQEKIHEARKKFRDYTQYCCSLVLWNSKSVFRSVYTPFVLSAAFGESIRFNPEDDPPSYQFDGSAKLHAEQNTAISAIVILTKYRLDHVELGTWRRLRLKEQRGERIGPSDQVALRQLLSEELGDNPRYSYSDTLRVIVLENPHARIPFPSDLFVGPFDQHWSRLESGHFELSFMGSELERLKRDGVPFSYL
jgi:hypothetical protein